jgi:hypothetical protein
VSRAQRKHGPREPTAEELAYIGADIEQPGPQRDIPGGLTHLRNPQVVPQKVPVKETPPYYRGIMAHGVPPEMHAPHERDDPRLTGGVRRPAPPTKLPAPPPSPVPVYIVEPGSAAHVRDRSAMRHITVPAAGNPPVTVCGMDPRRSLVQLLNEDATHHARFGRLGDLAFDAQNQVVSGGARLPAGSTSYIVVKTSDQLFAVSESSTPVLLSIILEFETSGAL